MSTTNVWQNLGGHCQTPLSRKVLVNHLIWGLDFCKNLPHLELNFTLDVGLSYNFDLTFFQQECFLPKIFASQNTYRPKFFSNQIYLCLEVFLVLKSFCAKLFLFPKTMLEDQHCYWPKDFCLRKFCLPKMFINISVIKFSLLFLPPIFLT